MTKRHLLPAIEPLEARIAPASVTFTDTDGDLVTVKTSKGTDAALQSALNLISKDEGFQLVSLTLDESFSGTDISITADGAPGVPSTVNVGRIDASGVDLGDVTVAGDLGKIICGDLKPKTPGLGILTLESAGKEGLVTQNNVGNLFSVIEGSVRGLNIHTQVMEASFSIHGNVLGAISVQDGLFGGNEADSGKIFVQGRAGKITVGTLFGGLGEGSGSIVVMIGGAGVVDIGTINGGGGLNSGNFFLQGGTAKLTVHGDVFGGQGDNAGTITVAGKAGRIVVDGTLFGGVGTRSGALILPGGASLVSVDGDLAGDVGELSAAIIGDGVIGKVSVNGWQFPGSGEKSAAIVSSGRFGTISLAQIQGGVVTALISAAGEVGKSVPAIGRLVVTGDVNRALIAAGYIQDQPVNPDASIGAVDITGSLFGSSIVAGVVDANLDGFGNADDTLIAPPSGTPSAAVLATIGRIKVGVLIDGTDGPGDRFAIEAEHIKSVIINGSPVALSNGAHNDNRSIPGAISSDISIYEINPPVVPVEDLTPPAFSSIVDVSLLDGTNGFQASRPTPGTPDGFGTTLTGIGDFNDDGVDDYAIGAPLSGNGSVYVVFGNPANTSPSIDVSTLNGTNGFRINGASAGDLAGGQISGAGDFDNDGVADLLIGAPGLGNNKGAIYVLFGRSGTFDTVFTLGTTTSLKVLQLNGETTNDRAGAAVATIGEFDGDAFDDILIGAPNALNGIGSAYVILGRPVASSSINNLSAVNGTNGFRIVGQLNHQHTGSDVAGIGDFNGDGNADIAVGSSFNDPFPGSTTYVIFGSDNPFSTNLLLGDIDGTNGFKIKGGAYPGQGQHLSGAGDINNDGVADLLLTSSLTKGNSTRGAAFAIFGRGGPFNEWFNLGSLDGTNGFRVGFGKFKELTFTSVAAAGDVNGDGIDDFLVSSAGFRGKAVAGAAADSGNSYVVFGHNGSFAPVFDAGSLELGAGFSIVNAPATKFFVTAVNAAGDLNDDGLADILIGSAKPGDLGAAYAVFGQARYLATDDNSSAVKFLDDDGDIISITIPGHKLKQSNFTFNADTGGSPWSASLAGGGDESLFDIRLGAEFANSVVRIKTTGSGDGYMHVGRFDAPAIPLKNIKIKGDVDEFNVGGNGTSAIGTLDVRNLGPSLSLGHTSILGTVNLLKVRGAMQNTSMEVGNGVASGLKKMLVTGSITESQVVSTGNLRMTVKGDIVGSTIDAANKIGAFTVNGNVIDSVIRAVGDGSTEQAAQVKAIKRIIIKGDIGGSRILAGYDESDALVNGHAWIGSVTVNGDWIASDLVAGIDAGGDGYFGTADDAAVGGGSFVFPSRIASIVVKGQLLGSAGAGDTFGFVAEQIDKFKVGGAAVFTPTSGPNNDLAILTFGPDGDVAIHEVNAPI